MILRMAAQLPALAEVERLSPLVIRILGGNPSKFTLQGTNTYLIGNGPSRILLDTGEGRPAWSLALRRTLQNESCTIGSVLLTHWHADHIHGVPDVLSFSATVPNVYKNLPDLNSEPYTGLLAIRSGQRFATEGATLRALHCPGHTEDHMAFVLEEENAMFTGDNVLGHGTAVFEDLGVYVRSLHTMQPVCSGRGYPGHGEVIENVSAKITEYITHRAQREREVLATLKESQGEPLSSLDIVKIVYKGYPESLYAPAERGVLQILTKLASEDLVERTQDGNWVLKI